MLTITKREWIAAKENGRTMQTDTRSKQLFVPAVGMVPVVVLAERPSDPVRSQLHGRDDIQVGWSDKETEDVYCDDCAAQLSSRFDDRLQPLMEFEDCLNSEVFGPNFCCSECGAVFVDQTNASD